MRIFEQIFFADKAKICRHTFVWQEFLTQYATKFAEKTLVYACEDRFLVFPLDSGFHADHLTACHNTVLP